MNMEDKSSTINDTNCPVSPKTKASILDETQILVNKFEASTLTSTDHDRNYYYNRLSQFRFPNDTTKSSSSEDTLLGSPFKPCTGACDNNPTSPQDEQHLNSTYNKYSPSTPRYTPSPSFSIQCTTTPSSSNGRLSHKRSIAVSISSSSMESIFSDTAYNNKTPDLDSARTSADTLGFDSQMFARKLDFSSISSNPDNHCHTHSKYHQSCHIGALPLPLIDLDLAAKDPKPRSMNTHSPSKKQHLLPNPFWDDTILEDEAGEELTSSSEYATSHLEPEEFKDHLGFDSYEPQIKGDSDEYIDLVDFLKETTVKETMVECELSTKSRMDKIHEDNYNPFQYIQLEESQWLYSPLCTPTVSRQSFN